MIWDDTEVTPGAAAVDTRMINSCQQSYVCAFKGKTVTYTYRPNFLNYIFKVLTFSIFFV